MALILALSLTVLKLIVSVPLVTLAVNVLSKAVFFGTFARMSKFVSTCWPFIDTLNTRWPALDQ